MKMVVTAVALLSLVAMASEAAPAASSASGTTCHFIKYPNYILMGSDMEYLSAQSLAECHLKCEEAENPECLSFMHQETTTFCVLSGENSNDAGLVPNSGTDVYQKECFNPKQTCHGFRCDSGYCIHPERQCDGSQNCPDGSDERGCMNGYQGDEAAGPDDQDRGPYDDESDEDPDYYMYDDWQEGVHWGFVNADGMYLCRNNDTVTHWYVCDGDDDCGDLTDERFCNRKQRKYMPELEGR